MSLKALSAYTVYAKYAHYLPEKKRRETWEEITDRVFAMHERKYAVQLAASEELRRDFEFAKDMLKQKRVLGSQRALQFGGKWIEKTNAKLFNCSYTYVDRPQVFQEVEYLLLCGCGVGFSVQKHHVAKLPALIPDVENPTVVTHQVQDSIEGWADAIGAIVNSYLKDGAWPQYEGKYVKFDYSLIRPAGALIAGQFKAPGPKGLENSIEKIRRLIERRIASPAFKTDEFAGKLRPIDAYDIIMHASDSVLSGGIRRSATISLFSHDDAEMMGAKTGNWFSENPQRGRSNNSVLLVRGETTWEQFEDVMRKTREFGEPGFYFAESTEHGTNPCFTIDTRVLTEFGWRSFGDLIGSKPTIIQDSRVEGKVDATGKETWLVDSRADNVGVFNQAQAVGQTGKDRDVYELTLKCGRTVRATDDHHFATKTGMKMLKNLTEEDEVLIGLPPLPIIDRDDVEYKLGFLAGHIMGDGTILNDSHHSFRLSVWGDENKPVIERLERYLHEVIVAHDKPLVNYKTLCTDTPKFTRLESEMIGNHARYTVHSSYLFQILAPRGFTKKEDLKWLHAQSKNFKAGFASGLFHTDGHTEWNKSARSISARISSSEPEALKEFQLVLQELGIFSRINLMKEAGTKMLPNSQREYVPFKVKASYRLIVGGQKNCANLLEVCELHPGDEARFHDVFANHCKRPVHQIHASRVVGKKYIGKADVYCLQEDNRRTLIAEGITARRCCEIGLYPVTSDGRSGVQFCNLSSINGRYCDTESRFFDCCRAAAIIGTIQAGYTNFQYLSPEAREITEREALLGVSITGMMDNPDALLSPKTQRAGAQVCKDTNRRVAALLGINPAARITCTKPEGSASCVLKTASGIHPHHARQYLRRAQANKLEFPLQHYKKVNPTAVEPSVWSANGTDEVISFACEVPKGAILKNDLDAVALLSKVKSSQQNWVLGGENPELAVSPGIHHNISNTVTVRPDEWEKVARYIYDNREYFTGVSLLASSGDLDYQQAPFVTVLTPDEIVKEYGDGSILASGLVVDGLHAFEGNLWNACDQALGTGKPLPDMTEPTEPVKPARKDHKTDKAFTAALANYAIELNLYYQALGEYRQVTLQKDWVRRAKQFADRYFVGDVRRATYCLKHVSLWHTWLAIKRDHKDIDWSTVVEESQELVAADTLAAAACAGGACQVV